MIFVSGLRWNSSVYSYTVSLPVLDTFFGSLVLESLVIPMSLWVGLPYVLYFNVYSNSK